MFLKQVKLCKKITLPFKNLFFFFSFSKEIYLYFATKQKQQQQQQKQQKEEAVWVAQTTGLFSLYFPNSSLSISFAKLTLVQRGCCKYCLLIPPRNSSPPIPTFPVQGKAFLESRNLSSPHQQHLNICCQHSWIL